jgi:NitT/TauT family transport system permease protein
MSNIGLSDPSVTTVDGTAVSSGGAAVASHRGVRTPRSYGRLASVGLPVLSSIIVIGLWWLATIFFEIRPFFLPAPPDIVKAFGAEPEYLFRETWVTLVDTALGFGLAIAAGLLISVAISTSTILHKAIMPLLVALNSVPKVALAPLFLVWMGFGQLPRTMMTLAISFFPIVVAATSGLTSMPSDFNELARSLSANRWQLFIKFRFPWALPQIFIGLKVGISLALIGAVVAELSGSGKGLGYVIVASGQSADTPQAFAAIMLLAAVSIGLFYLVVALERLLLPWAKEITA